MTAMAYEDIRVEVDGAVGSIIIDRGVHRNSLRPQSLGEIAAAVDQLVADGRVRAIVFRADGEHFSAGADFAFLGKITKMSAAEIREQVYTYFQGAARRLYNCPKPVVAAVQGAAITVGCELSLACDFRIVAQGAFFQESWVKLGILPPLGGLFLLPRLIGLGRATQMALLGEKVEAEEAKRIGLASEVVPIERLNDRAHELARELADMAPMALAAVKRGLRRGLETGMEAEFDANVAAQAMLLSSEDFKEGLGSVMERRSPVFKGL
ncbi:enoyl-CoA hydratase/isomerase family protein [Sphingobium sp. Sx8-8]|uniref:enoyl-CoA hydratase/isomerase family protein n=1 Tax=Sphingobium sp. Sx8-8 TaxID=2933617 RepID=UPI001F59EB86|nr:enoyl-CoA hydratase/isomerase family protein [Sphingobium sp. Sx8-8]